MNNDTYKPALLYLWPKRTLYIGQLAEQAELRQGAATLTISLDQPISFQTPDMNAAMECHSLVVPPGQPIQVNTHNAMIANCHLDVFGNDYVSLFNAAKQQLGQVGVDIGNTSRLKTRFQELHQQAPDIQQAYSIIEQLLGEYAHGMAPVTIDPRVKKVIALIQNKATENISLEELASAVNVSSPRLVQLFKNQTGLPIRRYRLWHRMFKTAGLLSQGSSMTEAAIAAGFSDSAHFAHTFRSMFGTTPSHIFFNRKKLRIFC